MPALAQWLVLAVLAKFLSTRPKVRVFVRALPSTQIAELVATRQFDIGVVEMPMSRSGVRVQSLPSAKVVVVLPAKHPLAEAAGIGLVSAWTPLPYLNTRIAVRPLAEILKSQYGCLTPAATEPAALAAEFQTLLSSQMLALSPS